jgi:hypothetical protein
LAAFLVLGLIFLYSRPDARSASGPEPAAPKAASAYEDSRLATDLAAVRRTLDKSRQADKRVDYQSPEWRLYGHFASVLSDGACEAVTAVRVWSPRTDDGFKVQGVCLDRRMDPAVLDVAWSGDGAVVTLDGRSTPRLLVHLGGEAAQGAPGRPGAAPLRGSRG